MTAAASLRERRARGQLLGAAGADAVEAAVQHLLAVQAQDLRAARRALRARVPGSSAADVDRALTDERTLVVGWLGRGTLHLVARDDYGWLLALTAPARLRANARRLDQEGVTASDAERGVRAIERALADEGPLTRAELAERVAAAGGHTDGQALPHLLMLAALRGVAVLGPLKGEHHAFALARDWLGEETRWPDDLEPALGELARRYLAAHGPASAADLAAWAGLPLRAARTGLREASDRIADAGEGLVDLRERARLDRRRLPARLLPAFDPHMLGWKDRSFAVPAEHAGRVHPGGGIIRAVALVDGLAAGTWGARRRDGALNVTLDPFDQLDSRTEDALRDEARDLARFEGLELDGFDRVAPR